MPEQQDLPLPTNETEPGVSQPVDAPPPPSEENKPNPLAQKYQGIREGVAKKALKVKQENLEAEEITKTADLDNPYPEDQDKVATLEEALQELEAAESMPLDDESYANKAKNAAEKARVAARNSFMQAAKTDTSVLASKRWEHKLKAEKISKKGVLGRLLRFPKLKYHEKQAEKYEEEHDKAYREKVKPHYEAVLSLKKRASQFKERVAARVKNQAIEGASAIKREFTELRNDLLETTIEEEMRTYLFEQRIVPLIKHKADQYGNVSEEDIQKAIQRAREVFSKKPRPFNRDDYRYSQTPEGDEMARRRYEGAVSSDLDNGIRWAIEPIGPSVDLRQQIRKTITSSRAEVVDRFVGQLGAESLKEYQELLVNVPDAARQLGRISSNNPGELSLISSEEALVYFDDPEKLDAWIAFSKTQTAKEIFGDELDKFDEKLYSRILNRACMDFNGENIVLLADYPRPETIRVLSLILTSDVGGSYAQQHATEVLLKFVKSEGWEDLLESTQEKYPLTELIIPYLRKYEVGGVPGTPAEWSQGTPPQGMTEANCALAASIARDFTTSTPELRSLAAKTLTHEYVINRLFEEGSLSQEATNTLRQTLAILEENGKRSGADYSYQYKNYLRSALLTAFMYRDEPGVEASLDKIKTCAEIGRSIIENQNDPDFVNYATYHIALVGDKYAPGLFVNIYKNAKRIFGAGKDGPSLEYQGQLLANTRLLSSPEAARFVDSLYARSGTRGQDVVSQFSECVQAGLANPANKEDQDSVLKFLENFKILTPTTFEGYKKAKAANLEAAFVVELRQLTSRILSTRGATEVDRNNPYYKDLLKHVYQNNSGRWSSDELVQGCIDKNGDLAEFRIEESYEIDLLSQSEIIEKEEVKQETVDVLIEKVMKVARKGEALGNDPEKMQAELLSSVDTHLAKVLERGAFGNIKAEDLKTIEEKMFVLLVDNIYGNQTLDPETVKELIITYEFAHLEDVREYIEGTTDRVSRSSNKNYALLCELNNFFADKVKEVNRRLVQTSWENPKISDQMKAFFDQITKAKREERAKRNIGSMRLEQLGMSDSFVQQMSKLLEARTGRKYTKEQTIRIMGIYEKAVGDMNTGRQLNRDRVQEQKEALTNPKAKTKEELAQAIYGQLRAQRERTLRAMQQLTGKVVDPKDLHLGEVNLEEWIIAGEQVEAGEYNEQQFATLTGQHFVDIFKQEVNLTEQELSKFESKAGTKRERLVARVTKSKESAYARQVGGVCVAGDRKLWEMPNYLQLVLENPESQTCVGLVLMHHFTDEEGRKILTVSLNPSSTYLLSVDEEALFNGLMGVTERFAAENNIDMIMSSQNQTIRTNRTGGRFEKALNERISKVGKTYSFGAPQQFSHYPEYHLQDMDVLWSKN